MFRQMVLHLFNVDLAKAKCTNLAILLKLFQQLKVVLGAVQRLGSVVEARV